MNIKNTTLKRVIIVDASGDPVLQWAAKAEESAGTGTPINNMAHLAGFLNSKIKESSKRKQPVPTGGMMVLYDERNKVVGKCKWVSAGADDETRKIQVLQDKIFTDDS